MSLYSAATNDTRKTVQMHFHCALFAEILRELAKTATSLEKDDIVHREGLREAAKSFYDALKPDPRDNSTSASLIRMRPCGFYTSWNRQISARSSAEPAFEPQT